MTLTSRLPRGSDAWRRAFELIPDFAIEVLSPDDRPGRVLDRITFYLHGGVRLIWIVDPDDETVTVYQQDRQPTTHLPPARLDASPVLPGFTLDLGELFGELDDVVGAEPE